MSRGLPAIALRNLVAPLGVLLLGWGTSPVLAAFFADILGGTVALASAPLRDRSAGWVARVATVLLLLLLLAPIPAIVLAWLYSVARAFSESPAHDWLAAGGAPGAVAAAIGGFLAIWGRIRRAGRVHGSNPDQLLARSSLVPLATRACLAAFAAIGCYALRGRLTDATLLVLVVGIAAVGIAMDLAEAARERRDSPSR